MAKIALVYFLNTMLTPIGYPKTKNNNDNNGLVEKKNVGFFSKNIVTNISDPKKITVFRKNIRILSVKWKKNQKDEQ